MGRTRKRPDAEGEEDERNVEELLRAMKRSLRSWLDTKVAFTVPSAIFPPAVVPSASRVPVAPGARDPTQIFRCITMSKNAITIPRANFTRLKQMLVDGVAMPGAGAMCHDSAVAQTPAEMEVGCAY